MDGRKTGASGPVTLWSGFVGDSAVVDEQPIDIHQYSRALRAAAPRIAIFSLIAAAAAIVFSVIHQSSSTYAASTTILAGDTLSTAPALDSTTAARRLATVNLLTRTTKVLSYAANRLDGVTVDQLRTVVGSSIDPNANVITITASGPTQAAATARADGVANALITIERQLEQRASTDARRSALAELARLPRARRRRPDDPGGPEPARPAGGGRTRVGGRLPDPPGRRAGALVGGARVAEQRRRRLLRRGTARDARRLGARTGVAASVRDGRPRPVLRRIPSPGSMSSGTGSHQSPRPRPPAPSRARCLLRPRFRDSSRGGEPRENRCRRRALSGARKAPAVAANLGRALSTIDARVLLVSADLGSPRVPAVGWTRLAHRGSPMSSMRSSSRPWTDGRSSPCRRTHSTARSTTRARPRTEHST